MTRARRRLPKSAEHLLAALADPQMEDQALLSSLTRERHRDVALLLSVDLVARGRDASIMLTPAGRAHLARRSAAKADATVDPFRAQHLDLAHRTIERANGKVTVDEAESPLAWL